MTEILPLYIIHYKKIQLPFRRKLKSIAKKFSESIILATAEPANGGTIAPLKLEILKAHAQNSFAAYYKKIRVALDALELRPGELILLNEAWYDEDYSDENESRGSVPLLSLDAALRYIRDEMQEEETVCPIAPYTTASSAL